MRIGRKAKIGINLLLLLVCLYGLAMAIWTLAETRKRFEMNEFMLLAYCFLFAFWGFTKFQRIRNLLKSST